jgi:MarR family transcriptional repressor of emrRAB
MNVTSPLPTADDSSSLIRRVREIETGMQRVAARFSELPVTEAMMFRVLVLLGRELSMLIEQALRPHGLNDTDFRTLLMLYSLPNGVAFPSDLCTCMGQSPANMTRVADALVERGLITRAPSEEDRRRMVLRVTPAGEALVQEYLPQAARRTRTLFSDVPVEERQRLLEQLVGVCAQVDRLAHPERTRA